MKKLLVLFAVVAAASAVAALIKGGRNTERTIESRGDDLTNDYLGV